MTDRCLCGKRATHDQIQAGIELSRCCECHIKAGGIAADWHPECMRALAKMPTLPTREKLAQAVIGMLDAQQQYFKSRSREDLIASKKIEEGIRKMCMAIISEDAREVDHSD